jgi:hypothetical protein
VKNNVKRAVETLEVLGFRNIANDYDRGRKMRLYVHRAHPDEEVRLYEGAGDVACRAAERRAHQIIDMEAAAPRAALSIKDRYKAQRERDREQAQRRLEVERRKAASRRANMSKQEIEAEAMRMLSKKERQSLIAEEENHHFYANLMRPAFGR